MGIGFEQKRNLFVQEKDMYYKIAISKGKNDNIIDCDEKDSVADMDVKVINTTNRFYSFKNLNVKEEYTVNVKVGCTLYGWKKSGRGKSVKFNTTSLLDGKWSVACCDKIKRVNDKEIQYISRSSESLYHKLSFGKNMNCINNNGIFEAEILVVNVGTGDYGFCFGVTTAQVNDKFACDAKRGWAGFGNSATFGCCFLSDYNPIHGGKNKECGYKVLKTNDRLICRLDLINNKVLFKVNDGEDIDPQFDGFDVNKKQSGYYFAYSPSRIDCPIRVIRHEKIQ